MKTVYVTPWYNCNLNCPHCDVHTRHFSNADFSKFHKELCFVGLEKSEEDVYVLFGGEPLLIRDRFLHIVNTGLIDTVSTNMLLWTEDLAKVLKERNISIATSYNPLRFSEEQLNTWLRNVNHARQNQIDVLVLITLTKDLFDMPLHILMQIMDAMRCVGVKEFLFEPYVGDTECNEEADEWLIKFHDKYFRHFKPMKSKIIDKLDNWNCDCSSTFTLEPTGELRKGCPQFKPTDVPMECLTCLRSDVCRPCVLQKTCSYPKKFAEWIKHLEA